MSIAPDGCVRLSATSFGARAVLHFTPMGIWEASGGFSQVSTSGDTVTVEQIVATPLPPPSPGVTQGPAPMPPSLLVQGSLGLLSPSSSTSVPVNINVPCS